MTNPRRSIMIVGDDQAASEHIAVLLEEHDYRVIIVHGSSRAIKTAEATLPDVFLLDLAMAPPDGFHLCKMLRKHRSFRQTPVLIASTLDRTDSKIVAIGAEANDFLAKPLKIKELLSKLSRLLSDETIAS